MQRKNKITLWTIQTLSAWSELNRAGIIRGKKKLVEPDWLQAYDWMKSQMKLRLGTCGPGYPIWLWKSPKPSLRQEIEHLPKGESAVFMTVALDPVRILASDFDIWHCVLNQFHAGLSKREMSDWDKKVKKMTGKDSSSRLSDLPLTLQKEMVSSWDNVFDLKRCQKNEKDPHTQAVISELRLTDVTAYRIITNKI
jgi:hypothetical protein